MNDPIAIARNILDELPSSPSELTDEHLPKISAAARIFVRLYGEITGRVEKLAKSVDAGDRSAVKKLEKARRRMARIEEAEAMLRPYAERAIELETEGPSL